MITELSIGNFKAFAAPQRVPIKPLTLIFGANSSGKSSIIHSLLLANHALETDNWDVRKPKRGGDMVDLGGFPHYLHRPQTEDRCSFGFEMALGEVLTGWVQEATVGTEEERAPFRRCADFRASLHVWKAPIKDADGAEADVAALQSLELAFNGQPALRFSRIGFQTFRCDGIEAGNPFIRGLLLDMLRFGAQHQVEAKFGPKNIYSSLTDPESKPLSEDELRLAEQYESQGRESLRQRAKRCSDPLTREEEVAELARVFSEVMAERSFELREGRLVDAGPDDEWNWAGWEEQLENGDFGGILGFFHEHCSKDLDGQRWAEAQAIRYNLTKVIEPLSVLLTATIRRFRFVGPIRPVPPRHLLEAEASGAAGDRGLAAWLALGRHPKMQESVNRWLGPGWLDTPYRLTARPLVYADEPTVEVGPRDLQFEDVSTGVRLGHPDLGFGISQVLPVLVDAASEGEQTLKKFIRRVIAVEQPELHLHPAMQAALGDVFIESALGERKNTFLLETHSEHLVLRIMRRMRETYEKRLPAGLPHVRPEDVSIVYVERDGASSIVREMPLNDRGELVKAWPGGFFEEGLREMLP